VSKLLCILLYGSLLGAQTAEELVQRNLQAKGGVAKIKALRTLRMSGKLQQGMLSARIASDAMAPNQVRETFTLQGMSEIHAYDGKVGWKISPFEGRKDAEMMGEQELRDIEEDANLWGPLVDYQAQGNKIEYLGHDSIDGDDVYRLKITLKNGDIQYYFLDPETFLEVRVEKVQFIHGTVHESVTESGSYKLVAGVYIPFTQEMGSKQNPENRAKVTWEKIEANVTIDPAEFQMPGKGR
jgi:hypothetical protein